MQFSVERHQDLHGNAINFFNSIILLLKLFLVHYMQRVLKLYVLAAMFLTCYYYIRCIWSNKGNIDEK